MLSINHLEKSYGTGVKALDGVSLEIGKGMFGLLGPNGAGKSSLMRTLATLQEADSGTAFLNDIDILNSKEKRIDQAESQFTVNVNRQPASVGIDPFNKMIDRNSDDNVTRVSLAEE